MEDGRSPSGAAPRTSDPPAVRFDDEEQPARALTGTAGRGVAVVAAAVALLVLWQVFRLVNGFACRPLRF